MKHRICGMILLISVLAFTSGCVTTQLESELNPSVDTVEVGSSWNDPGCHTNGDVCILFSGQVDTSIIGNYELIYQSTGFGEITYLLRVVTVVDTIAPIITLNPGIDTVQVGTSWIDAGCSYEDNYDDSLIFSVIHNEINLEIVGKYQIIYQVIDNSGNTSTITRSVFVFE